MSDRKLSKQEEVEISENNRLADNAGSSPGNNSMDARWKDDDISAGWEFTNDVKQSGPSALDIAKSLRNGNSDK